MHLAYFDDSAMKGRVVMSAVIVEDGAFRVLQAGMSGVRDDLVALIPKGRIFEEFHACHLYQGHGVFEGIDQDVRFQAINRLLGSLEFFDFSVVYGCVDVAALKKAAYGSANPRDITFRACLDGIKLLSGNRRIAKASSAAGNDNFDVNDEVIGKSLVASYLADLVILIVDDGDKQVRDMLHATFRGLALGAPFHDDMYFGDSRYSIGIQLADLCSYFIAKHHSGDTDTQGFYDLIEPHIKFSGLFPEPSPSIDPVEAIACR